MAGCTPSWSRDAGRNSVMRLRNSRTASSTCATAWSTARLIVLGLPGAPCRCQPYLQRREVLQRLVVQLPRPACPLALGGLDVPTQRLGRHLLRGGHSGGRAGREGEEDLLVVAVELRSLAEAVKRGQHAEGVPTKHQRHEEPRLRLDRVAERGSQALGGVVEPFRAPGLEDAAGHRALNRNPQAQNLAFQLTGRRYDPLLLALLEQDDHRPCLDQRPPALDDQLQDSLEVGLSPHRPRDCGRGLEAHDRALQLVPALGLTLEQAGVVDGERGPVREHDGCRLVVIRELPSSLLVGEVEVAEGLAADEHRHSQEAVHRGMARREPVGARMVAHMGQAQRLGLGDQHSEHPPPAGEVADLSVGFLVDPDGEKAPQGLAVFVEHSQRGVARSGDLSGGVEKQAQDDLALELGDEAAASVDQALQAVRVQCSLDLPILRRLTTLLPCRHTDRARSRPGKNTDLPAWHRSRTGRWCGHAPRTGTLAHAERGSELHFLRTDHRGL